MNDQTHHIALWLLCALMLFSGLVMLPGVEVSIEKKTAVELVPACED